MKEMTAAQQTSVKILRVFSVEFALSVLFSMVKNGNINEQDFILVVQGMLKDRV